LEHAGNNRHEREFLKNALPHIIVVSFSLFLISAVLLFIESRWGFQAAQKPNLAEVNKKIKKVALITIAASLLMLIKGFYDYRAVSHYERAI